MEGSIVVHNFNPGQITTRRSEDLRKEFSRLDGLSPYNYQIWIGGSSEAKR